MQIINSIPSELLIAADIATQGFAVGIGDFKKPPKVYSQYSAGWEQQYQELGGLVHDPVVQIGVRKTGLNIWENECPNNEFTIAAADHQLRRGAVVSSEIGGNRCILGVSTHSMMTVAEQLELTSCVKRFHRNQLIENTEKLSPEQIDLVSLVANGVPEKHLAVIFDRSIETIKQRKLHIKDTVGVKSFYTVVHLCALAGRSEI